MSQVQINNLTFSYDGQLSPVFENVNLNIDTSWKTGLIGRNGIGKSTLFKILMGELSYQGKVLSVANFLKFPAEILNEEQTAEKSYQNI